MTSPGLDAKPIVGYSDPIAIAPGQPIDFMVSTRHPTFEARLVRLRHGDRSPDGPGLRYTTVDSNVEGSYRGQDKPIRPGSYVTAPHAERLEPLEGLTLQAWIYPTAPHRGLQGIITKWFEPAEIGYGLFLEPGGAVSLRIDHRIYACASVLRPFEWAFVSASWDARSELVRVRQLPITRVPGDTSAGLISAPAPMPPSGSGAPVVLGGHTATSGPVGRFNGKVDSPRIYGRALGDAELDRLFEGTPAVELDLLAAWNLAADTDAITVHDESGHGHHGTLNNHPTRGVTGRNWTGEESIHHRAPAQYNAAYFHDDDLEDAEWEPDFTLHTPPDLGSGIYAMHVTAGEDEDWIPFFVRPSADAPPAPIVFLAPTLSYLAYANEHSAADNPVAAPDLDISQHYQAADHYAIAEAVCGLYDHHPDGTGVCYSSWRRPIVNMRPDYTMPLTRSAHQLSADLHLVDWMEEKRFAYDVVTDHDLHQDGVSLLAPYRVLVTGSHPEYWTHAMLDGLQSYLDHGGRLMYLGGNGFYWVTSISTTRPHVIEVRRGRRGTGTWRSEPGEDYHSTTGEQGGLWRDRGRAPQRLTGVGMAAQGFDTAIPYTRSTPGYADEVSWIFDGVRSDVIGGEGLVMGGAAGLEVDRMDHRLGTLPDAVLLATADQFSDSYQHVVEEVASSDSRQGGSVSPYVRADMVYSKGTAGSEVFSTGSIAWCGSLSSSGYDNDVSRITENVLRRFSGARCAPPASG